jgi:hypothetical protein
MGTRALYDFADIPGCRDSSVEYVNHPAVIALNEKGSINSSTSGFDGAVAAR